ncbi:MAG: dipeptide/oligopeptide/nickel ABC transporter ATP-binding protein, partial [Bauldia litoralis]
MTDRGSRPAQPDTRETPLLAVDNLRKHFPVKRNILGRTLSAVQAVDDVSFEVRRGETLGIVGESGCGKSTTARLLMRLIEPDAGVVVLDGKTVGGPGGIGARDLYRDMQMVFQDSYASLNPRMPITMSIAYGPLSQGMERKAALAIAVELLEQVGLDPTLYANRYPHELSGGQKQRVNIARALALRPRLVILDEAVS